MLISVSNSSSEPSGASTRGVRCLSSEHAVIVKEQTAQAIANTAHAYEKSGVEAALSEVRMTEGAPVQEGRLPAVISTVLSHFCDSVFLLHLTSPSLFLHFFLLILSFCCRSVRKLNPRNPCPQKQTLQSSQSSPQRLPMQTLLPRLILRCLKSRFPVWGGFWLELMQTDMMRRYRAECKVELFVVSLTPSHVTACT